MSLPLGEKMYYLHYYTTSVDQALITIPRSHFTCSPCLMEVHHISSAVKSSRARRRCIDVGVAFDTYVMILGTETSLTKHFFSILLSPISTNQPLIPVR